MHLRGLRGRINKGTNKRTVIWGGIECEYFKNFPTNFFVFGQDLLKNTFIMEKHSLQAQTFLKRIPASKTLWITCIISNCTICLQNICIEFLNQIVHAIYFYRHKWMWKQSLPKQWNLYRWYQHFLMRMSCRV